MSERDYVKTAALEAMSDDELRELLREDGPAAVHDVASELLYERHMIEVEAEQRRLDKLPRVSGSRAVRESGTCEQCGKTAVLYERVAYTLGYEGHPGAEQTAFQLCASCLTGGEL